MKVKFFVVNEVGGCFLSIEELCKAYCKEHGYTYRTVYIRLN